MSSETAVLRSKIAALRERLDKTSSLDKNAADDPDHERPGLARLWELERQTAVGADLQNDLQAAVSPHPDANPVESGSALPLVLTSRARRILERGREQLNALKALQQNPRVHEPGGLMTAVFRETAALVQSALRLATNLPNAPGTQLQACEGIEAISATASRQLQTLQHCLSVLQEDENQLSFLQDFLDRLETGREVDSEELRQLATKILQEAGESAPLRFVPLAEVRPDRSWVIRQVAGHSLSVARVMARLVRQDPEWRGQAVEAVSAALVHDVGMLTVPAEILSRSGTLSEDERRVIEAHCVHGSRLTARLTAGPSLLQDAATHHHERCNGTGYPDGLQDSQLSTLVRLLAVCDVYAAACQDRPHRASRETRTALTDTLLLADKGALDRRAAERLLGLSFYPAGSVVELSDGSIAGVLATPKGRTDLQSPARPIVTLLIDTQGQALSPSRCLDLAQSEHYRIVRTLGALERRQILGTHWPAWAL